MGYMSKSLLDLHVCLKNGEVTSKELIDESLKMAHSVQNKCNAFVSIIDGASSNDKITTFLSGIPYGVKDNYSTKGILSTGSSNTLKDYVPFFDATAVHNLKKSGAIFVVKTAMDEFGMGGYGITAHTGIIKNPHNLTRIAGGSSAGSAASVAAGVYPYALGSDTGDSIRKPAAYCGIVGYKPTYGMISRYGLFAFASSMDTCGVFTRNVEDACVVVDKMKGIDKNDMTTFDSSDINLYKDLKTSVAGKKLCYIKELCDVNNFDNPSSELVQHLENFHKTLDLCESVGIIVDEVSVDQKLLNAVSSVYNVISCAEATSNMSNLTGISFGPRMDADNYIDSIKDFRTKGFSSLIKRRFVIGSYVLQSDNIDKYFRNAQRVRRMLVDKYMDLFKIYDGIILPVGSGIAPLIRDVPLRSSDDKLNALENHLQIGNFGGFPSITVPNGYINNMPVAFNITGNIYKDQSILSIAYRLEKNMDYKDKVAVNI